MSAVSKLSLRRDPIRLVLSRGPWAAAWYLLGYLVVGWALFAIALSTAVAGAGLSITFAGLPVLVAAAAAIRWCADVERARLRPMVDGPVAGSYRQVVGSGVMAQLRTRWRDPATWRDIAYLVGMFVPLLALDAIVLAVWWGFLAGITLPIWYWAPWKTIHGVRYHGYDLGYHPNGPHGPGGWGLYVDTLPKALARRRRLPDLVPDLQLRRRLDRPRPRGRRSRAARPGGRPAAPGERSARPSRPAVIEPARLTVPAHEGPAHGRGPGRG